jgi:hypothetical protein
VKSTNEHNLSHEAKTGVLRSFVRRAGPDDLEAQVKALKEIQRQPGFIVRKPLPEKKDNGFFAAFKKILVNGMRLFSGNKPKPAPKSPIKGGKPGRY